jgi:diguanylate cyclase (GGDEF)-like protein
MVQVSSKPRLLLDPPMENLTSLLAEAANADIADLAGLLEESMTQGTSALLDALQAYIVVLDADGAIVSANRAWMRFAASNPGMEYGIGRNYPDICDAIAGEDARIARQAATGIRSVLQGGCDFKLEYPYGPPEDRRWFLLTAAAVRDERTTGAVVMHLNITDRKRAEDDLLQFAKDQIEQQERLDYLACYDVLTGLANRTLFLERTEQHLRGAAGHGNKLALCLLDLERFRNINDTLGRPAGDELLRQVAQWLTAHAGGAHLVARIDTDRFALLLPRIADEEDAARYVEQAIQLFSGHPFDLNGTGYRIALKAGIASFPGDGEEAEVLSKHAEAALKKAKSGGDRYVFYDQKMTEAVAGRLSLENRLGRALELGEYELHYQPEVELASGRLVGVEALLRWNDPRSGLIAPGRFIPILEETGLIHEVGRWALGRAIGDYLGWRGAGLPAVRVAVNLSPLQLRSRDLMSDLLRAIAVDADAAAGLELELTETLIMEDVELSTEALSAIRAKGVRIAIDDFGTGFSSLSYLSKLPVDTIKIDRSFVVDMAKGPEGMSLVSIIINLAHSLKLKVVAVGVETEEQSRLLRLLGCDEMQGFLVSKALPAAVFADRFLAASKPRERSELN